jgi:hypothetical protein
MNINKFSAFNYFAHQSSDVFEMSLVVGIGQCIFDFKNELLTWNAQIFFFIVFI